MATLRQLRTRVASVHNIQRVTHAMQLVAAAKVRRAQENILAARPYAQQLERTVQQVCRSLEGGQHALMSERPVKKVAMVVVSSDRGLCGGFNTSVCRRAQAEMKEFAAETVELVAVGRKGRDFFRNRGYAIHRQHLDVFRHLVYGQAVVIAQDLSRAFVAGEVDRVLLLYSEFKSLATQVPVVRQLLPILPGAPEEGAGGSDVIFEPDPERLLEALVPRHVTFQVWRALLESNAGEQAARMTAMDSATKNAGDLIGALTREMNKERQSAITLELLDIVGGAEAVAG
jgi:F-type H+-transporting ATPase subunit gamma